jgi:ribokinase
MELSKRIMVFGSFVADLMSRAPHLPVPGETVMGSMFRLGAGGKGFNQAIAVKRSGGDLVFSTKLGRDGFARLALDMLTELSIDTSSVFISDEHETGTALIMVDENSSQNQILVVLGACGNITEQDISKLTPEIKRSGFLLTQLEVNTDATEAVINTAFENNVKVILNPAPVQMINKDIYKKVYIITPNEVEASVLSGIEIANENDMKNAACYFTSQGVENVIITLGDKGVYVLTGGYAGIIPCFRVKALDTTGAGDAFSGSLAAALAEGMSINDAARFAQAAAALSVTKIGTSGSMPARTEIDAFLAERSIPV